MSPLTIADGVFNSKLNELFHIVVLVEQIKINEAGIYKYRTLIKSAIKFIELNCHLPI
jgi:hypothetical protein